MYFIALFLGAGAACITLLLQALGMVLGEILGVTLTSTVAVLALASIEEASKAALITLRARGVLLGTLVGIGFAIVEFALRLFGAGLEGVPLWVLCTTPLVHILSGALYGVVTKHAPRVLPYTVIAYTALHAAYNAALYTLL